MPSKDDWWFGNLGRYGVEAISYLQSSQLICSELWCTAIDVIICPNYKILCPRVTRPRGGGCWKNRIRYRVTAQRKF
ncbi:hypothetical protein TIFTF001_032923 [Ficus carica]|uniref:Uncharacterized protein n=1 Tax=Ficus carica TaxID=3494 RepID=A0AA88J8I4_FICCA|nr:hypothetical protein TIFTF001_032923 [Ficus carica]